MNRKAIFISMISLVTVSLLFVLFTAPDLRAGAIESEHLFIQTFIEEMELLEKTIIPLGIQTYVRKILDEIALEQYKRSISVDSPTFTIDQILIELGDCMRTVEEDGSCSFENAAFSEFITDLETHYRELHNTDLSLLVHNVSLQQISTWELLVQVNTTLRLDAPGSIARFDIEERIISTRVSIEGLIDPLSSAERLGDEPHRVVRAINYDWNNITHFRAHAWAGTYRAYNASPSYLNRLAFNTAASPTQGILSLIRTYDSTSNITAADFDRSERPRECLRAINFDAAPVPFVLLDDVLLDAYSRFNVYDPEYDPLQC